MKLGIKSGKLKIKTDTPKGLRAVSCGCCGCPPYRAFLSENDGSYKSFKNVKITVTGNYSSSYGPRFAEFSEGTTTANTNYFVIRTSMAIPIYADNPLSEKICSEICVENGGSISFSEYDAGSMWSDTSSIEFQWNFQGCQIEERGRQCYGGWCWDRDTYSWGHSINVDHYYDGNLIVMKQYFFEGLNSEEQIISAQKKIITRKGNYTNNAVERRCLDPHSETGYSICLGYAIKNTDETITVELFEEV